MKRSASDAGPPPAPRQLHIPAIPVFNPPAIEPPPPPSPTPLPPTMATVHRYPTAIWPQPHPALFTFAANQAHPPGSRGLTALPVLPFHDMRLANLPPSGNPSAKSLPGSSGRYTRSQVAEKTELTVKLATPADLSDLADTLRQQTKVSKITIITRDPKELGAAFDAIRTSMSVLDVEVHFEGPMPEPGVLNRVFSGLRERQAPIKSFRWVSNQPNLDPLRIDQFVLEALLTSQLLEKLHFSGPRGHFAVSVNVNDADHLAGCVAKHQSLRSISFQRIDGSAFIDAILQGAAGSPIIEEIYFDQINLISNTKALQSVVTSNKRLRSISIKDCSLDFFSMTQMLKSMQNHPALESLDFKTAKISADELQLIGEPIGELLVTNSQLKILRFGCTLSPANITALTLGLNANTRLAVLDMKLFGAPIASTADLPKTDTLQNLGDMFESNKGVREMVIELPTSENNTDHRILKSIAKSTSIESLTIKNLLDIQQVKDSLADHPHIKQLNLRMQPIGIENNRRIAQSVHQLAERLRGNKNLLSFSLTLHPNDERERKSYGFFSDLKPAIRSVDDVTIRNRIRTMAPLAGIVMSRRQDPLSHVPGAVPKLPAELNQLLFEAVLDYISPSDAQKLYDTVLPFTPLPENQ